MEGNYLRSITLNDRIIIDCTAFISILERPDRLPTTSEAIPSPVDSNYLTIGGWKFNVESTIYHDATTDAVVKGWNLLLKSHIDMSKLFSAIFVSTTSEYLRVFEYQKLTQSEFMQLDIIILPLLRLCYWYYKCSILEAFSKKDSEIRQKIVGSTHQVFESVSNEDFENRVKKLRDDIENCSSELMFAAMSHNAGKHVSFDGIHDLVVEGVPGEVKTIHDKIPVKRDDRGNYFLLIRETDIDNTTVLKQRIVEDVTRKKWSDHIKKAIDDQGGRIIFINATFSSVAQDFNALTLVENVGRMYSDILKESIELAGKVEKRRLPVIVVIGAMYDTYHQSHFLVKVPVKLILDLEKFRLEDMYANVDTHSLQLQ